MQHVEHKDVQDFDNRCDESANEAAAPQLSWKVPGRHASSCTRLKDEAQICSPVMIRGSTQNVF